jgi:7-cyano-7-deazaguanine synthase
MPRSVSPPTAIVLLSGGLDSATCLALARSQGHAVAALSFDYGQRHWTELDCARSLAKSMGAVRHDVIPLPVSIFGSSALTDPSVAVPKNELAAKPEGRIPVTYVPARNALFLAFGLSLAESLGVRQIWIGVNAIDYSGYPDCRPEFLEAFEKMMNLGTKAGVSGGEPFRLVTPLVRMTKGEIIRLGLSLGVDYGLTSSCYDPTADGEACGACDACLIRAKGFREAGAVDPLALRRSS